MIFDEIIYKKMQMPIEEIKEDILARKETFANEPWYNDFILYLSIGVCQPKEEHITSVRKALKIFGHETQTKEVKDNLFIVPYVKERTKQQEREER